MGEGFGKDVDSKCRQLTATHVRQKHDVDNSIPVCSFYENFDIEGKEDLIPNGVYNLDDLRHFGNQKRWCPYFLARHAITVANVVVFSYNYVLDPKISEMVSKDFENNTVVVFDEAHNIDGVCTDSLSYTITRKQLDESVHCIDSLE